MYGYFFQVFEFMNIFTNYILEDYDSLGLDKDGKKAKRSAFENRGKKGKKKKDSLFDM